MNEALIPNRRQEWQTSPSPQGCDTEGPIYLLNDKSGRNGSHLLSSSRQMLNPNSQALSRLKALIATRADLFEQNRHSQWKSLGRYWWEQYDLRDVFSSQAVLFCETCERCFVTGSISTLLMRLRKCYILSQHLCNFYTDGSRNTDKVSHRSLMKRVLEV